MARPAFEIIFDIETLVKVQCLRVECKHNLMRYSGDLCCNLKHLIIDEEGQCENYDPRPEEQG